MANALILVDIQNDYFPGGAMALEGMENAADNAARLLARFRERGEPLIHVRHISTRPGATFFLPGTPGAEIDARVTPAPGETVLTKHFPNAFRGTELLSHLQALRADGVLVCGAMSHMCIDATVRAAFDFELACAVAHDACATRELRFGEQVLPAAQVHAAFMAALAVPYASVRATSDLLGG